MSAEIQHTGVWSFRVPRSIIVNGSLRHLSGDALALFLTVSYRCFKTRSPEAKFSFRELLGALDMGSKVVDKAAKELRLAGLLHHQQDKNIMSFQIQQPDGSKAKSYMREQPPTEDSNKIDVGSHVQDRVDTPSAATQN